jgi:hypothetical protein
VRHICGERCPTYNAIQNNKFVINKIVKKGTPAAGLEWTRGFQEAKVPRFHDKGTGWW